MLLKIGDAERHDVLRVEQVALSKAHDTFSMATELHVSIKYRVRTSCCLIIDFSRNHLII